VRAVLSCRTPVLGGHLWKCSCRHHAVHHVWHSCNHRSCPVCGALDQRKWAATQEARLLPGVPYFLVTLTVPDSLRGACRRHPAILYDLLLREGAGALKDLCQTKLGGLPGFTAVLHTWGRQMQHHPHVHLFESGTNRPHVIALHPDEFLRRWLTHVLPKGFVRVRHFGWMSGAARKTRLLVRALVCGQLDEPAPILPAAPVPRCPHCGAEMKLIAIIRPRGPPRVP
jgi:hypothetical protein